VSYEVQRSLAQKLGALDIAALNAMFDDMALVARDVVAAGAPGAEMRETRQAFARFVGQGHEIAIDLPARPFVPEDEALIRATFHERYRALYGTLIPELAVEILTWKTRLEAVTEKASGSIWVPDAHPPKAQAARRDVMDPLSGAFVDTAIFDRTSLSPGDALAGPALVVERDTTSVVPCGFRAQVGSDGTLILTRQEGDAA